MEIIMAEVTGDSPQAVAFALLEKIASAENWSGNQGMSWKKPRQEILDAYKECLDAVLGTYQRFGPWGG
jgi:hypothetical protein